ncbi:D-alanyl-D-alanine carboxypeptidase [Micromonospora sp. B11E3]|uniref:D-alanyl-D-alanine carboxypeptidase n=1 Tax=Micromonospora sp. B11E3 TaxID=3153562 RepID=UPI00325E5F76
MGFPGRKLHGSIGPCIVVSSPRRSRWRRWSRPRPRPARRAAGDHHDPAERVRADRQPRRDGGHRGEHDLVGGTLRSRMRGTPAAGNVHAKTGSLTGASSLSGYVTAADGHLLAFSVVLNNYLASSVKGLEDQIAIALATYDGQSAGAARLAPPTAPETPRTPEGVECPWVKPILC